MSTDANYYKYTLTLFNRALNLFYDLEFKLSGTDLITRAQAKKKYCKASKIYSKAFGRMQQFISLNPIQRVTVDRKLAETAKVVESIRDLVQARDNNGKKKPVDKFLTEDQYKELHPKMEKTTVKYPKSDFGDMDEYLDAMRKPPITQEMVDNTDWDELGQKLQVKNE